MIDEFAGAAIRRLADELDACGVPHGDIAKAMFCHAVAFGEVVDGPDLWLEVLTEAARDMAVRSSAGST